VKRGRVFYQHVQAGIIEENDNGYLFKYDSSYLQGSYPAISVTLPKQEEPFRSTVMFSFFDGLIPEGWLLDIAVKTWKIDYRDRMELLLSVCGDVIGAVSVTRYEDE
jgi:serine/threonine-protein kinase HipA